MAVISTEQRFIGKIKFDLKVRVLRDGKFRIKYPGFVAKQINKTEAVADSLEEVKALFWKTVKGYQDAATKTTRIIIYDVDHTSNKAEGRRNAHFHCDGIRLQVAAKVFDMIELDIEGRTSYSYNRVTDSDQLPPGISQGVRPPVNFRPDRYIEFTLERRDFFVKLYEAMESLIEKVVKINEPGELALAIDNGVNLLEAPK